MTSVDFDNHLDGVALSETEIFGALAGDYAFDQVVSHPDDDAGQISPR